MDPSIIDTIKSFIPVVLVVMGSFMLLKLIKALWIESKANEWLLVIRNGKMIKSGIGMSSITLPGD